MKYYVVDAFTDQVFKGGPAGVLFRNAWLDDEVMQNIAMENNLADTAFVTKQDGEYYLRWFMPKAEIDLNGHATLAAGYIFFRFIEPDKKEVTFHTKSGDLIVKKEGDYVVLDFPRITSNRVEITDRMVEILGKRPIEAFKSTNYTFVYESETDVKNLTPNYELMKELDSQGAFVTSVGDTSDIVGRAFWPMMGVNEDPVCGNMHCNLVPIWKEKLHKDVLVSHQLSPRGATVFCESQGERVILKGRAALFLEGEIFV